MSLPKPREGWSLGLDVSVYQGPLSAERIEELRRWEVCFIFARAVHGITPDTRFEDTAEACAIAGMPLGAYGVLTAAGDAEAQAQAFLSSTSVLEAPLPPVLDFEVAPGLTGSKALARARRWLDAVEDGVGRQAIVYTYPSFWSEITRLAGTVGAADAAAIATRPLWIAHYGVHSPIVPPAWEDWTLWQASGNGAAKLPGTSVDVDVDWYRGPVEELRALGVERADVAQVRSVD